MASSGDSDLFGKGSLVEVSSEAGHGFPGGWYLAKILERLPPSTPPGSSKKEKEATFLVEYERLRVKINNVKTKLVKAVNYEFIRPVPPPPPNLKHQIFEPNDVVDVYHVEGWRPGVVFKALDEPGCYSVKLKNPPHLLICYRSPDLRPPLDWVHGKWVPLQKQQKEVVTSNQKREGGNPLKSLLAGKECDRIEGAVDKMIAEDCATTGDELVGESTGDYVGFSCPDICGRTINQLIEFKQRLNDDVVQYDAGAAMNDDMPCKDQNMRFFEDSPVLRFIQAMDVFQSIPQEPHFRPLAACEEVCREGLALGHMMTFVNVAKKISTLQASAPRNDFDNLFKFLSELELQGFNVEVVRSRLLVLQSLKDSEEQLHTKQEKIKSEIIEQTHERSKVKAELEEVIKDLKLLEDKKREVEEKKARLISMNNEKDSEIAKLKSGVGSLFEEIKKVNKEFKGVAGSPWKK
ncbi:hypothetical protein LWI29_037518 [Acer saccharum]|uniref:Agenet domain-containing protein n=1 Tax=Acer saccharum TaxID=4024 RepID=A0AA39VWN3_ACESA|nr:hypothetical protein LWI29_037518 [Acer saccharum]